MTTTPHEQDIRTAARDLRGLRLELNILKGHRQIREARTTRPTPGPQAPTQTWITSLEADHDTKLHEIIRECIEHIERHTLMPKDGFEMCTWLSFRAQQVSELAVAPDLLDLLKEQIEEIRYKLMSLPGGGDASSGKWAKARVRKMLVGKYADLIPELDKFD